MFLWHWNATVYAAKLLEWALTWFLSLPNSKVPNSSWAWSRGYCELSPTKGSLHVDT